MMVVWLDYKKVIAIIKSWTNLKINENTFQPLRWINLLIQTEISGGFQGQQGVERAKQIAELLNAGSLPVDLKEVYSNSVGAQFGQDALDKTILHQ